MKTSKKQLGTKSQYSAFNCVEPLEDRTMMSTTLMVTNVNDSGAGSLRQAMLTANAGSPNSYVIDFKIGSGAQTINLKSPLPATSIDSQITFDGTTQPGYAGSPLIDINGSQITTKNTVGLSLNAMNDTVKGLAIDNFTTGISVGMYTDSFTIENNYLGVHSSKTMAIGIANGVDDPSGAIKSNAVENCTSEGIFVFGANGVSVSGNYVADNATGILVNGADCSIGGNVIDSNTGSGISVQSSALGVLIGGSSSQGNYIALNGGNGITIANSSTQVSDNLIGSNTGAGVDVTSSSTGGVVIQSNQINYNTDGVNINGTNVQVDSNVINNNKYEGVIVSASTDAAGTGSSVVGNTIDSNQYGVWANSVATIQGNTIALNNSGAGIEVVGISNGTLIGGSAAGQGNNIHNNGGGGVNLALAPATIIGNTISTNNAYGIYVGAYTNHSWIENNQINGNAGSGVDLFGENALVSGNTLSGNLGAGVYVSGANGVGTGQYNTISENSMFSNTSGGIELVSGANQGMAAPSLTASSSNVLSLTTSVTGSFKGWANTQYRIELFATPGQTNEGELGFGSEIITTNSSGVANFSGVFSGTHSSQEITATATMMNGSDSTGAFSNAVVSVPVL